MFVYKKLMLLVFSLLVVCVPALSMDRNSCKRKRSFSLLSPAKRKSYDNQYENHKRNLRKFSDYVVQGNYRPAISHLRQACSDTEYMQELLGVLSLEQGNSLFFEIVKYSDVIPILYSFLECEINFFITDDIDASLLHNAAYFGSSDTIEFLSGMDLDVNQQDNEGYSALHRATQRQNLDNINMLLRYGASVDVQNEQDQTSLHLAIYEDFSIEIIQSLLAACSPEELELADTDGATVLHAAAQRARPDVVALLIKAGANEEAKDFYGQKPCDCTREIMESDNEENCPFMNEIRECEELLYKDRTTNTGNPSKIRFDHLASINNVTHVSLALHHRRLGQKFKMLHPRFTRL